MKGRPDGIGFGTNQTPVVAWVERAQRPESSWHALLPWWGGPEADGEDRQPTKGRGDRPWGKRLACPALGHRAPLPGGPGIAHASTGG